MGKETPDSSGNLEDAGRQLQGQSRGGKREWVARVLVALVFFINVQCALQFVLWPGAYTAAYQLEGASAEAVVRSIGICFLMWNATYPPVIVRPGKYRVLFAVMLCQQAIGLVGESLLYFSLGPDLVVLASSVMRFIVFDAAGLVALVCAFFVSRPQEAEM
uniref:Uncharacterized protein n=1 Tax=uncultured bacterium Contig1772 TaxID=1393512 RepID=W0FJS1_9BACT|nr:hypothetical protein [uncultured bacterium Contig1772]